MRLQYFARSSGLVAAQPSNAARAALAAASTSSAVPGRDRADDLAVGRVEDVDRSACRPTAPRRRRCRSCRAPALAVPLVAESVAVDAIAGPVRSAHARRPRSRPSRRLGVPADRRRAPPSSTTSSAIRRRHGPAQPRVRGRRLASVGPRARPSGATFKGRNKRGIARWSTKNRVVEAEPGKAFAFETQQSGTRWTYRFEPDGDGTVVTESRAACKDRPLVAKAFAAVAPRRRRRPRGRAPRRHARHPRAPQGGRRGLTAVGVSRPQQRRRPAAIWCPTALLPVPARRGAPAAS